MRTLCHVLRHYICVIYYTVTNVEASRIKNVPLRGHVEQVSIDQFRFIFSFLFSWPLNEKPKNINITVKLQNGLSGLTVSSFYPVFQQDVLKTSSKATIRLSLVLTISVKGFFNVAFNFYFSQKVFSFQKCILPSREFSMVLFFSFLFSYFIFYV